METIDTGVPSEGLPEENTNDVTFQEGEFDRLKIIYDFQYDSLVQTTNILEKGFAFYLLLLAGSLGYLFSNVDNLHPKLVSIITDGMIVTTIFVMVSISVLIWGIIKGLQDLKQTLRLASGSYWSKTSIEAYFKRGFNSTITIGILATIILIFFLVFAFNLNGLQMYETDEDLMEEPTNELEGDDAGMDTFDLKKQ